MSIDWFPGAVVFKIAVQSLRVGMTPGNSELGGIKRNGPVRTLGGEAQPGSG